MRYWTRFTALIKLIYSSILFPIGFSQPKLWVGSLFAVLVIFEFFVEIFFILTLIRWMDRKWTFVGLILFILGTSIFRLQIIIFLFQFDENIIGYEFFLSAFGLSEGIFSLFIIMFSFHGSEFLSRKVSFITKFMLRLLAGVGLIFGLFLFISAYNVNLIDTYPSLLEIFLLMELVIVPILLAPLLFVWSRYRFRTVSDDSILYPNVNN